MDEKYQLNCVFLTDLGKLYTLIIHDPDTSLTATRIKNAMITIIDSEILMNKNGMPAETKTAKLIKTEAYNINVA